MCNFFETSASNKTDRFNFHVHKPISQDLMQGQERARQSLLIYTHLFKFLKISINYAYKNRSIKEKLCPYMIINATNVEKYLS